MDLISALGDTPFPLHPPQLLNGEWALGEIYLFIDLAESKPQSLALKLTTVRACCQHFLNSVKSPSLGPSWKTTMTLETLSSMTYGGDYNTTIL